MNDITKTIIETIILLIFCSPLFGGLWMLIEQEREFKEDRKDEDLNTEVLEDIIVEQGLPLGITKRPILKEIGNKQLRLIKDDKTIRYRSELASYLIDIKESRNIFEPEFEIIYDPRWGEFKIVFSYYRED